MMEFWFYYGIVLPAIIGVIGYAAMRYHEWKLGEIRKHRQQHPGE